MNYVHFALGKTVKSTINVIHCVRVYIVMKHFRLSIVTRGWQRSEHTLKRHEI